MDNSVTTPPGSVQARSWKMNEETKRWVLVGHDALNQAGLIKQIEAAEGQQLLCHVVFFIRQILSFLEKGTGSREIMTGSYRSTRKL
jgi:hypothetical protein